MSDNIFEQDFDQLMAQMGVQTENTTDVTNVEKKEVEPEQVEEAAEKAEKVASKSEKKEKTTEDYRVDIDVLELPEEDDAEMIQAPKQEESKQEAPKQDASKQKETKQEAPKQEVDVWGDPLSAANKSSSQSVWDDPKPNKQENANKGGKVWGGSTPTQKQAPNSQSTAKTNKQTSKTNVWDGPSNNTTTKKTEKKASVNKTEKKTSANKSKKVSKTTQKQSTKPKETFVGGTLSASVDIPEKLNALLDDETRKDIEARAKGFIYDEMKKASKKVIDEL